MSEAAEILRALREAAAAASCASARRDRCIRAAREAGFSIRRIAEAADLSRSAVARKVSRNGTELR